MKKFEKFASKKMSAKEMKNVKGGLTSYEAEGYLKELKKRGLTCQSHSDGTGLHTITCD
ncbi:MAG: putative HTH transcriptional regulator [Arenicella sp.]|jgi:predicted HTH transcriptional regulator